MRSQLTEGVPVLLSPITFTTHNDCDHVLPTKLLTPDHTQLETDCFLGLLWKMVHGMTGFVLRCRHVCSARPQTMGMAGTLHAESPEITGCFVDHECFDHELRKVHGIDCACGGHTTEQHIFGTAAQQGWEFEVCGHVSDAVDNFGKIHIPYKKERRKRTKKTNDPIEF